MTRKQMKKFAKTLYECELIHRDPNSSKEEKKIAENQIMAIANQIMMEKDGMDLLLEIDTMVQEELIKEK